MANLADELELFAASVDRFCERRVSVKVSEVAAAFANTNKYDEQGFVSPINGTHAALTAKPSCDGGVRGATR